MKKIEITKMSSRGQVVIPKGLRKGLDESTRFITLRSGETIMLRKIPVEEAWKRLERLMKEGREIVKRTGLKESDVPKIIAKMRRERRKRLAQTV